MNQRTAAIMETDVVKAFNAEVRLIRLTPFSKIISFSVGNNLRHEDAGRAEEDPGHQQGGHEGEGLLQARRLLCREIPFQGSTG